jgi:SAM-dependent methyltransferase
MSSQLKRKIKQIIRPWKDKIGVSRHANVDYNRQLWDEYSRDWDKKRDRSEDPQAKASDIKVLGDEWGSHKDVQQVLQEYIYPFISMESIVAEIGVGGGRLASQVVGKVKEFHCFDISQEMLKRTKSLLAQHANVHYTLLQYPQLPRSLSGKLDFVYSFDVFVHLDLHTIWQYFQEFNKVLKDKGRLFVHTTNLLAPGGWERFQAQDEYKVEGHYFVSPEIVNALAAKAKFKIIKASQPDPGNFYYNRDYLIVLQKDAHLG